MRGAALMCLLALCAALSTHYFLIARQNTCNEPYQSIVPLSQQFANAPLGKPIPLRVDKKGQLSYVKIDDDE